MLRYSLPMGTACKPGCWVPGWVIEVYMKKASGWKMGKIPSQIPFWAYENKENIKSPIWGKTIALVYIYIQGKMIKE